MATKTVYTTETKTRQVVNPTVEKYLAGSGKTVKDLEKDLAKGNALFLHDVTSDAKEVLSSSNPISVALWSALPSTKRITADDLYTTETYEEKVPHEVQVEDPPAKKTITKTPLSGAKVGGNTSSQKQQATTTTTQSGSQTQGTDQAQHNQADQSLSGQGNVALVVTPNAESNQQLESQAFGSASQTQQVEVASQADAASQMSNAQDATAAQYNVAPVINIDAADVYNSSAQSDRDYQRTWNPGLNFGDSTVAVIAGVIACAVVVIFSTKPRRKKNGAGQ